MAKQRHKNRILQFVFGSAGDDLYLVLTLDGTGKDVAVSSEGSIPWAHRDAVMLWLREVVFPEAHVLFTPEELSCLAAMGFATTAAMSAQHCIKGRPA